MGPNLHSQLFACASLALLVLTRGGHTGITSCPPEAGELVAAGWRAYRADSIAVAAERFTRSDQMCEDNYDAKVGLAYTHLRSNRLGPADSLFELVTAKVPGNGDAWDGLTLTRWRKGDRIGALTAARKAIALNPTNSTWKGKPGDGDAEGYYAIGGRCSFK